MLNTIIKSLQVYGIAIIVSMLVALMIKIMVTLTGLSSKSKAKQTSDTKLPDTPVAATSTEIPEEVVAAIAAAVSVTMGQHRILHIAQGGRAWSHEGRSAQHTHQPRH